MNKRIWEIYGESLIGTSESNTDVLDPEKFAELIVEQCAEMVANDPRINWLDAAQIAKEMREKFAEKA